MRSDEITPVTEDEVRRYMATIPSALRKCASAQHDWQRQSATPYNRNQRPLPHSEANKAAFIEITQRCAACELERTCWLDRTTRTKSTWSYDHRNKLITSPRGVYDTGISVRYEVAFDLIEEDALGIAPPTQITTKTTRAKKKAAA